MISNDKTVISERAQQSGLFRRHQTKTFFHRLNTGHQMRVGASTANARQHLGDSHDGFTHHRLRKKTLVLIDGELYRCHPTIVDEYLKAG